MGNFHLKGLNGIRAIAAIAVLVSHILQNLVQFNLRSQRGTDLAGFGVTMFFSLSGFLITLLLLKEKNRSSVTIGKFYIRRILRIWPLYFLYILLAFVLVGFGSYEGQIFYYLLFVPNIPFVFGGGIPVLVHYWSLGVEEQFYLFWPLLIKYCNNILVMLLVGISFFLVVKLAIHQIYGGWSPEYTFVFATRFDCMAIGGLGGYFFFHEGIPAILYGKLAQGISWAILLMITFNQFHIISFLDQELIAGITVVLIINQCKNPATIISLDKKVFEYIGKLSFGIYVYHPMVIALLAGMLKGWTAEDSIKTIIAFILTISGTIALAHISYFYFELFFLRIKRRFEVVIT